MRSIFGTILAAVILAVVGAPAAGVSATSAWAQVTPPDPTPGERQMVEPPSNLPKPQRGDRVRNLDFLFEALKLAPDEASAKHIEERIWALWIGSQSDTANLLMTRVKTAVEAKDEDLALKLLDSIVEIKPDYVEAWNRRATIYFQKKDYGRALADLRQVLAREPRHFGAMAGLGLILQEIGDEKRALDVYRRALEIHPRMQKIPDIVKTLTDKVQGRDI
jgi:tetratricopeptide (TPR) repeat protein